MSNNHIQDRAEGALLGAWIGDALGLGPHWYYNLSARFHNDFESAVLHAVNGGGQNQVRAILTGALTGAQTGLSGIPQRFLDGLENIEKLREMATDLAVQATNV